VQLHLLLELFELTLFRVDLHLQPNDLLTFFVESRLRFEKVVLQFGESLVSVLFLLETRRKSTYSQPEARRKRG